MSIKVLCLGNNTEDTDTATREISKIANQPCHGLLSELEQPLTADHYTASGYYHTSIFDLDFGRLVTLMNCFDQIIVLDQPMEQWSHCDAFFKTLQACSETVTPVTYISPAQCETYNFFSELVKSNKSFCIFPFIELLVNYNYTTVCCRSAEPITKLEDLGNFHSNPDYKKIRDKMVNGTLVPEHCSSCYNLESQGIVSARQQETVEWAHRLNLKNLDDLSRIYMPAYYEVRASNKCNILCRSCSPESSHLIEKEYKSIGLTVKLQNNKTRYQTGFDIVDFDHAVKIYVAGGEPTVMPEFYKFLEDCVNKEKTNIEFLINTNGITVTEKFKTLLKNFSNFHFVFSIDGLDRVNHYIRWPSKWNKIISNWHYLRAHGHKVHVNVTISIYNVSLLHELFEFIDQQFPGTLVHCQFVDSPRYLSPKLFPNAKLVMDSLDKVKNTNCYHNDPLLASTINGLYRFFQTSTKLPDLREFFKFNDTLDRSRNINLADFIPELDKYRV